MPRSAKRLTKADLDELRKSAQADAAFWKYVADGGQPGLVVQARRGRVRFIFDYKAPDGTRRRIAIDDYGAITLDQARSIAQDRRYQVAQGLDPATEGEEAKRDRATVGAAVAAYLADFEERVKGPKRGKSSSFRSTKSRLEKHVVPRLGKVRLRALTEEQIRRLHSSMKDKAVTADHTMTDLAAAFSYAEEAGLTDRQLPRLKKKDRFNAKKSRRAISNDELIRLGERLTEAKETGCVESDGKIYPIHGSVVLAIRLFALTGLRRGDLLGPETKADRRAGSGLRWKHVDAEAGILYLEDPKIGEPQELRQAIERGEIGRAEGLSAALEHEASVQR